MVRSGARQLRLYLFAALVVTASTSAFAQTPPFWNNGVPNNVNNVTSAGCGYAGCAIKPVAWPTDAQWIPYSWGTTYPDPPGNHSINDLRNADPSNGGTTPQNYVSVSSGCPDGSLPSIYYFFNTSTQTIFFRWRVQQIANEYAIGPSPGAYASTDPWHSALWTVFLSLTGTGYRDFAAHLDGSSGAPSTPVDILRSIWSGLQTNSIDYLGTPGIYSLYTNPTGFVQNSNNQILQFDGNANPTTIQWPNGSSETIWDYGTTRSINISTSSCPEFFVDYEIPLAMLDATADGGPKMTADTPFQFLFATANSLNNPFQKDVVWEGGYVCNATAPAPFGDALTLNLGIIPQPISTKISAGAPSSCIVPVTAQIMDALTITNCQTVNQLVQAQFKYWYDANGNGLPDDAGGQWVNIGNPTVPVGTVVTANWDISNLVKGQYLIALEITDNRGHTTQTWAPSSSWTTVTTPFGTDTNGPGGTTRHLYSNAPTAGTTLANLGVNYAIVNVGGACGAAPPTVTKVASTNSVQQGGSLSYTMTINNTSSTTITVSQLTDTLPSGFSYQSNGAGTLGAPSTSPSVGATGTVTWTFPGGTTVPGSSSRTFIFNVNAGTTGGTFFNSGTFTTNVGSLTGTDATGVTVHTASLTVSKGVALQSAPSTPITSCNKGDTVRFPITVVNNSQTTCTNVQISDALPSGFTYVAASPAPTSAPAVGANGTVTWSGLTLASGGGSFSGYIDAVATVAGSFTNTVNVTSTEASPVSASANLFVNGPILTIAKTANTTVVVPTANVTYTLEYANVGTASASITTLTDSVPADFTLTAPIPAGCAQAGGAGGLVTCTINNTLTAGSTATVTLVFSVGATALTSLTNTATINASNAASQTANFTITPQSNTCVSSTYYFHKTTNLVSASSTNLGVGHIVVTNGGTGYTTAPTISFTGGGGGSGAAATPHGLGGVLQGIDVTAAGSGYTSAPTVNITGVGTGAAATAIMTSAEKTANSTIGSSATNSTLDGNFPLGVTISNAAFTEIERFYSDLPNPPTAGGVPDASIGYAISTASVNFGWHRLSSNHGIITQAVLADFNPSTNVSTTIATGTLTQGIPGNGSAYLNGTITLAPANYVLPAGHRLLWIISAEDSSTNGTMPVEFDYDGSATTNTTGSFDSNGVVCLIPVRIGLTKTPSKLEVNAAGDTLTYTLQYNNPSSVTVTGVTVSDPIPAGMTYASASPAPTSAPAVGANGTVTWNVGSVAAAGSGTLTLNVNVTSSIVGPTSTNTATLTDTQTPNQTASAMVTVAAPNVLIAKKANRSNVIPGDVLSYTITVVNSGNAAATGVTVTDPLPSFLTALTYSTAANTVGAINISAGGTGYTTAPTVSFSGGGGTGAAATAIVSGGAVVAINITNPGSGYTSAPSISFGGPGTGAAANAQLVGNLTSGSLSGQNLTFNIGALGIGASSILNVTVQVATTGVPAGQTPVTNTASVVDGYNTTPRTSSAVVTVTATPNLVLSETATPSANRVDYVTVTSGGSYSTPPTVSFSGGGCTGATATVSTNPPYIAGVSTGPYTVVGVTITNAGSGCTGNGLTGAPTVVFTGSGTPATANAYVGPAPGDTITYVLTLSNTGTADASGCVITGTVPNNTTYTSGGTFAVGQVSSTSTTVAAGGSTTLTYVVTVGAALPTGVTSLPQSGSATSTNATAPGGVSSTLSTGAAPAYTITKSPNGNAVGDPLATISSSVSNSSGIVVNSSSLLSVGGYVAILNGGTYQIAQITAISGTGVSLSTAVTASAGTSVLPVQVYSITYGNSGNANGTSVTVSDTLPANMLFGGIPTGATPATTTPVIGANGTITWKIDGTVNAVSVTAGGSGYTSAPTVLFSGGGGTGAAATATVSGGAVTAISVTNRGTGYTSAPTVSFSGGGGSSAAASASIVTSLTPGGSGSLQYLAFPTSPNTYVNPVTISDGTTADSRNASATASTTFGALNPSKATTTSQVIAGNTAHYVITVQNPLPSTTANNVIVTDTLSSGFTYKTGTTVINGIASADPGGTASQPAWSGLSISANSTLTIAFDANVSGSEPTGVYQNQVSVSSSVPSLIFDFLATTAEDVQVCDPAPTILAPAVCGNATGVASIPSHLGASYTWSVTNANGTIGSSTTTVNSVTIGAGGSGYTSAPSISFTGGGGSGATATATVSGGVVTAITVTNPGSGYTSSPTVNISGVGTGATASAVLGTGVLFTAGSSGTVGLQVVETQGTCSVTATGSATINAAPSITTNISDKNVCPGNNLTLAPSITGATTFQWQSSTDGGVTFSNLANSGGGCTQNCVSGATTSTLTVTNVQAGIDGTVYRLVATSASGCSINTGNATLHVTCTLDLSVSTNSASPNPVTAGNNITYTQNVSNLSSVATTQVVTFTQSVPTNTTFVSMTPPAGWSCTTPAVGGTGTVTCTTNAGVVLAANSTTPAFTFVVAVGATTADGATITDTATVAVTAPDTDSVASNNSKSVSVTAQRRIDVAVKKSDDAFNSLYGPGVIYPGDPATSQPLDWFINVTNNGPSQASSVSINDPLPSGFTYSSSMLSLMTAAGSGYTSAPTVNLSGGGGTGATAVAVLGGGVASVTVTTAGTGYTTAPSVSFSGGGGSGAAATAYVSSGGVVTVQVTSAGSGYTSAPSVLFSGGGGTGAAATATTTGTPGTVGYVKFTNAGSGYSSAPSISLSGGGGTGAGATASLCSYSSGNAVLTCSIGTLNVGQTALITVTGTTSGSTELIPNTATASYAEIDTNTANDSSTDTVTVLAPTVVKMLTFDALQAKNGNVAVIWSTSYESDNLGFYVWRSDANGGKTRLNKNIITGSALFSGKKLDSIRSYRFNDATVSPGQFAQYWVEDVDIKGLHTMHGPVSPHSGSISGSGGTVTDPDPTLGSVGGIFTTAPGMGVTEPGPSAPAAQRLAQQWIVAGVPAAKLIVTQPGWYGIKKSDLVAAGFDPGTDAHAISVFADGVEVPIAIKDGQFGSNDTIEFYGSGIDTPSTGGHVYYVTSGVGKAVRIKTLMGAAGGGATPPASYPFAFNRTERTIFFQALTNNGDRDNFYGAVIGTWPTTETLTVANLDPNGGNAKLDLAIQGASDQMTHNIDVQLNGHDLGTMTFLNQARSVYSVPVPASWLTNGDNTLTIQAVGNDDDISVVDTATLTYPHLYAADQDALAFTMPAGVGATITGFTSANIRVVDLTDPQNPTILPDKVTAGSGTNSVSFTTVGSGMRSLLAFADDRVLPPAQIAVNLPSTLNSSKNAADLVIITNKAFLPAATTLQSARNGQGIKTMVVDVQNVYDEFSYGEHGPDAIRAFLQRATTTWTTPPHYAILLGDASWDPRNYYGFGSFDFVPTRLLATQYLKTASDDWFADFNDTATAAIPIGRIPVRTLDEANGVVNKLVRRVGTPPADPWAHDVEIIADRPSFVNFDYGADQLAATVPAPYNVTRLSFARSNDPTTDVINAFNNGSLLMDYIGHGSVEIWSNYVFSSSMADALTNGDKLPFVVTMNCLNGYFNDVWAEGLAEALLKNPNGGAIGAWASSALTSPDQQLRVNLELYRQVFGTKQAIGDAILKAKATTQDRDVRMTWILFGDPTMRLIP